jgi:predicted Zn finger-like uncharacterized protein
VPINAVCPECQTRFRLQDAMAGKVMRCTTCQEMFVVRDAGPEAADQIPEPASHTHVDAPPVVSRSGNVTDFVPVITDVAAVQPPRPAPPIVHSPTPVAPPREVPWVAQEIKPPASADFRWEESPKANAEPAPREVIWSPDVTPPEPSSAPPLDLDPVTEVAVEDPPTATARPTRVVRQRRRRLAVLIALIAFVLAGLGAGGFFLVRYVNEAPIRMMAAGKAEYEAGNWAQARKLFDDIAREHPRHDLAPEARFMSELTSLRQATGAVSNKEDPQPALDEWNKFLKAAEDESLVPFAAKGVRGVDIWDAGVRLEEDLLAKGAAQAATNDPDGAEKWLTDAGAVERSLGRFRPDDAEDPPRLRSAAAALRGTIEVARKRRSRIEELNQYVGDTDQALAEYIRRARAAGLDKEPTVQGQIAAMDARLQSRATYTREPNPIPPTPVPDDGLTSLLFAPRADRADRRQLSWTPAVFFCQARGVLYALDEADGQVRWAARTGLDTDVMPVRVPASDVHPELVLIASNTGNQFGITARGARDGRPLWHQSLAVPCQGPPAVVGPNAYVSLGDPAGTILEVSLATGEIIGRIALGRPLGPTVVARPGTGTLYVPADARAVYVFNVYHQDADGRRLEPVLLGVMNTGHPRGSLRGVPVFSNPDPNEPGPKYLVLGQADGLDTMKLRAFRLPEGPDGRPVPDAEVKEIPIPGWASFPPHCDGEKVAVVTDQGQFGLYGLALNGNPADDQLFAFPSQPNNAGDKRPSRGQVVAAEEGTFWILAGGELRRFRFGVNQREGVRLIPHGDPIPAGEPLQNPQVNARCDTFVVVTQEGMTCRATAVDSRSGEIVWRRDLGLMAKGDPLRTGDSVLVLDQAGGFYRIDTSKLTRRDVAWLVDENWLVAQPARGYTAVTGLIPGPDGSAVAVLVGDPVKRQLLIRRLAGNAVEDHAFTDKPPPAGQPIVSGTMLLLPLADGIIYRLDLSNPKAPLEAGPPWRGERLPVNSVCYLAAISDNEFFATDGARTVVRRRWPPRDKYFDSPGKLRFVDPPAAAPVVLSGSPPWLIVADGQGRLTMVDGNKLALPALKTWRPGANNDLPAGPVTDGLRPEKAADGSVRIAYTVGGRLVWLPPDAESAEWVGPAPVKALEGRPVLDGNRLLLTDRAGVVRVADARTGKLTGEEFRLTGSHAFAAAAVPVGANRILVPLADGTVVLGELKPPAAEAAK